MERIFDSDDIYFVDDRGRFLVFIRQDGEPSPVFYPLSFMKTLLRS